MLFHNLREFLVALDQACNVLVCLLTLRRGWSDETLSAHCWRSYRDGKFFGLLLMPPIDWLFAWQKADPQYTDEAGNVITSHCRRSWCKEKARAYLPPDYR